MEKRESLREPGLAEGRGKQRQRQRTSCRMALPGEEPRCVQSGHKDLSASAVTSFCSIPCRLRETEGDPRLKMSVAMEAEELGIGPIMGSRHQS